MPSRRNGAEVLGGRHRAAPVERKGRATPAKNGTAARQARTAESVLGGQPRPATRQARTAESVLGGQPKKGKKPPDLSSLTKRPEQPPDTVAPPQRAKPPALDALAGPSTASSTGTAEDGVAEKKKPLPPLPQPNTLVAYRAQLGFGPRPPPPLPTSEELQAARAVRGSASTTTIANEAYREIDTDNDGTLSHDEVKAEVRRRCPAASEEYLDDLTKLFDADGSGSIDVEEFEQLYTMVLAKRSAGRCSAIARCCRATRQRCRPAESREGAAADRLRMLCSATTAGCAIMCALLAALIFLVLSGAHCCPNGELEVVHPDDSHIPLTAAHGRDTGTPGSCPTGVGIKSPCVMSGFNQTLHSEPNVDIIFVTDQSSSMRIYNVRLEENFGAFIEQLTSYTHYWRIIVANSDNGCLSNEGGTYLTPETENFEDKFVHAVEQWTHDPSDRDNPNSRPGNCPGGNCPYGGNCPGGSCSSPPVFPWTQALLTPAMRAVQPENVGPGGCNEGFLRDDALLHIVVVSDETEQGRDWSYNIDSDRTFRPGWELALEALVVAKRGRRDLVEVSGFTDHQPELPHDAQPTCTGVPMSCERAACESGNNCFLPGTGAPSCTAGFTATRVDCFTAPSEDCQPPTCEVHPPEYEQEQGIAVMTRRSRCETESRFNGVVINQQGNYRCCNSTTPYADHIDCVSAFEAAEDGSVDSCPLGCHYTHNGNAYDGCICNLGDADDQTSEGYHAHLTTTDCDKCASNDRWGLNRCNINKYWRLKVDQSYSCTDSHSNPFVPAITTQGQCLAVDEGHGWWHKTYPTWIDPNTGNPFPNEQYPDPQFGSLRGEDYDHIASCDGDDVNCHPFFSARQCWGCGWCSTHGKCMCELGSFGYKQAIAGLSEDGSTRLTKEGLDADIATEDWQAAGYIRELALRSTVFGTYGIGGLPANYTRVFVSLDSDRLHGPRTYRDEPNPECNAATCNFDIEWTNGHAVLRVDTSMVSFETHAHGNIYVNWEQPLDRGHDTCELATCEPDLEPACDARLYTADGCQFGRCSLAVLPPLTAISLCIAVLYWFPEIFFSAAERRTPARLESESAKMIWGCRVATLSVAALVLLLLAYLYVAYFSCCGDALCDEGSWETEPFIMTTDDSVDSLAVHHVASRSPDGALRVDQCRDGSYASCDEDSRDSVGRRRRAEGSGNSSPLLQRALATGSSGDSRRLQAQGGGGDVVLNCVGAWSGWSACPRCGGTRTRRYSITVVRQGAGNPCPNENGDEETEPCDGAPATDCTLGWHNWGGCNIDTRTRQPRVVQAEICGGTCTLPAAETEACTPPPPCTPSDCETAWNGWGGCVEGTRRQTRTQRVTRAASCGGTCDPLDPETRPCDLPCVGSWQYSDCFCSTNGNGDVAAARNRTYVYTFQGDPGGTPCPYPDSHVEEELTAACNHVLSKCCVSKRIPDFLTEDYKRPPCPIDCVGAWTCWSACSLSCGGGLQTRHFEVSTPAAHGGMPCLAQDHVVEERPCNEEACPICDLPACTLAEDARPIPGGGRLWPSWCCCWGLLLWLLLAALPLALAIAWHFRNLPSTWSEAEPEIEQVAAVEPDKEEFTMWILFLLDPSGIRHAVEVMSNEWSIETIYAKALAATGIPVEDQILKFGGRALKPGKKLTSYGVQHGSEIVIEAREGKAVETRQGKQSTGRRREIKKTKGRQAI